MNADMNIDPQQIRDRVDALLADLPDIDPDVVVAVSGVAEGEHADLVQIEQVGRRLDEAHQVLVDALESVEKG